MANLIRGEVPFKAAGREMFICYGTRELAAIQAALGFRRPSPFQADLVEEMDEAVFEQGEDGKLRQKEDEHGPVFRRTRILVDAAERQRRMLAAFEACWLRPDPEAALICFREGLRPWERANKTTLTPEGFNEIAGALGTARIQMLHMDAISNGIYLRGEEQEEDGEGKAASVASVS